MAEPARVRDPDAHPVPGHHRARGDAAARRRRLGGVQPVPGVRRPGRRALAAGRARGRRRGLAGAAAHERPGQRDGPRPSARRARGRDRPGEQRLPHRQGQGRRARPEPRRRAGPARGGPRRPRARTAGSASTSTGCGPSTRRSSGSRCSTAPPAAWSTSSSPCATVEDLAVVRRRVDVPVAADESIRRAEDPYRVRDLDAADVAVLKVQPLGGVRACLRIAEDIGLPVVVSSALETSVGIAAGVALAAALPELPYACGLATVQLLTDDVAVRPLLPVDGALPVVRPEVDAAALDRTRAAPETASEHWRDRLAADRFLTMTPANASTALATVLLDELVRCGVRDVVLAPGSRSAALAFAAYAAPGPAPAAHPHRRAVRGLPRGRAGPHQPAPGRGGHHQRHRGREPAPGRARGLARRRAAAACSPPTGRPGCAAPTPTRPPTRRGLFGGAVRDARRRAGGPPRQRRGRAAAGRRPGGRSPRGAPATATGSAGRAPRAGAPQPAVRGAAGPRDRRRLGQRARRRPRTATRG